MQTTFKRFLPFLLCLAFPFLSGCEFSWERDGLAFDGTLEELTTGYQEYYQKELLKHVDHPSEEQIQAVDKLVSDVMPTVYEKRQNTSRLAMVLFAELKVIYAAILYEVNEIAYWTDGKDPHVHLTQEQRKALKQKEIAEKLAAYNSENKTGFLLAATHLLYCSWLALLAYTAMGLFALYNIFMREDTKYSTEKKWVFSGSWVCIIALGLMVLYYQGESPINPVGASQILKTEAKMVEKMGKEAASIQINKQRRPLWLIVPCTLALLGSYICVSFVPVVPGVRRERSMLDELVFGGMSAGMRTGANTTKYDVIEKDGFDITNVAGGFENKVGEKTEIHGGGCLVTIFTISIAFMFVSVFAPFIVCYFFYVNHFSNYLRQRNRNTAAETEPQPENCETIQAGSEGESRSDRMNE